MKLLALFAFIASTYAMFELPNNAPDSSLPIFGAGFPSGSSNIAQQSGVSSGTSFFPNIGSPSSSSGFSPPSGFSPSSGFPSSSGFSPPAGSSSSSGSSSGTGFSSAAFPPGFPGSSSGNLPINTATLTADQLFQLLSSNPAPASQGGLSSFPSNNFPQTSFSGSGFPGGFPSSGFGSGANTNSFLQQQCQSCKDANALTCLAMSKKCSVPGVAGLMIASMCKKSCGRCTPCPIFLQECTSDEKCRDASTMCSVMANPAKCNLGARGLMLQRMCPVSCLQCLPCPKPPVTEPECRTVCEDKDKKCEHFANVDKHCSNPTYRPWMEDNCPVSCNLCKTCPSTTEPSCTDDCEDAKDKCSHYAEEKQYCTHRKYQRWMSQNCQRSCKVCTKCSLPTDANTTTASPTTTTEVQVPTCNSNCQDLHDNCTHYAEVKNYCSSFKYRRWMSRNCRFSCRLCPQCVYAMAAREANVSVTTTISTIETAATISTTSTSEITTTLPTSTESEENTETPFRPGVFTETESETDNTDGIDTEAISALNQLFPDGTEIDQAELPSLEQFAAIDPDFAATLEKLPGFNPFNPDMEQVEQLPEVITTIEATTQVMEEETTAAVTAKYMAPARCQRVEKKSASEEEQCISAHNYYRCLHGAAPLKYNRTLAENARNYAMKMAEQKATKKSINSLPMGDDEIEENIGENVAINVLPNMEFGMKEAITKWYAEGYSYNYERPGASDETKHFTQLVWKNTTAVGCGMEKSGDKVYIVAQYFNAGNDPNSFATNVEPSDKECNRVCQIGKCGADTTSRDSASCKCMGTKNFAPVCSGSCVVRCDRPSYHVGHWLETCQGRNLCTCNTKEDKGSRHAGAWCQ